MTDPASDKTEPQDRDTTKTRWPRVALIILLLNLPLFYHGCDRKHFFLSTGTFTPMAKFSLDDGLANLRLESVYPVFSVMNVAVFGAFLWLLPRYLPRVWTAVCSRKFIVILIIVILVLNSVLIYPPFWCNVVLLPSLYVLEPIQELISDGRATHHHPIAAAISSRVYFVACIGLLYALASLHRLLFTDLAKRQISLARLMAAMVIISAGLGLVIRLIINS